MKNGNEIAAEKPNDNNNKSKIDAKYKLFSVYTHRHTDTVRKQATM